MQLITALNMMLIASGESIVQGADASHPLQGSLLLALESTSTMEQSKGWWFNEYFTTLTPDLSSKIILPDNTARIRVTTGRRLVAKGNVLMDKDTRSDIFTQPVPLFITELWDFEELPQTFAMYVASLASVQAAASYNADQLRMSTLVSAVDLARMPMMKEHVDNARVNLLETPSMANRMVDVRLQRYGR